MRSFSVRPTGGRSPSSAAANCQRPLRLRHWERVSCGRGYSGWALPGPTSSAHAVRSSWVERLGPLLRKASTGSPSAAFSPPWPSYWMSALPRAVPALLPTTGSARVTSSARGSAGSGFAEVSGHRAPPITALM